MKLGIHPSVVLFNSLMSKAASKGDKLEVLHWNEEITKHGLEPDSATYNILLQFALQQKDIAGARWRLSARWKNWD